MFYVLVVNGNHIRKLVNRMLKALRSVSLFLMAFRKSYSIKFLIIATTLIVLLFADLRIGSVSISFEDIFKNLSSENETMAHSILWQFRLPKALTCILAGAGLAASGLLMQTLFRNPLAGPDVLGLSSGASLAVGL